MQQSSVHSYHHLDLPSIGFIKQLHLQHHFDHTPYEEEPNPHSSPVLKRATSIPFTSKIGTQRESGVRESMIYTSMARKDENKISKLGLHDLKIQNELEGLQRENRKLREDVRYWREEK